MASPNLVQTYPALTKEVSSGNITKLSEDLSDHFVCHVCECSISGAMQAESHAVGSKHKKKLDSLKFGKSQLDRSIFTRLNGSSSSLTNSLTNNSISPSLLRNEPSTVTRTPASVMNSSSAVIGRPFSSVNGSPSLRAIPQVSMSEGFFCSVCEVGLNGEKTAKQHLDGKMHARKLKLRSHQEAFSNYTFRPSNNDIPTSISSRNDKVETSGISVPVVSKDTPVLLNSLYPDRSQDRLSVSPEIIDLKDVKDVIEIVSSGEKKIKTEDTPGEKLFSSDDSVIFVRAWEPIPKLF